MKTITKLLKLDQDRKRGVYFRIQDSRFPLPTTSASGWVHDDSGYEEGQVCFFAGLINAVEMLTGKEDGWGNNYADEIRESGGTPALVAAVSKYEIEDGSGAEVILWKPKEIGRWHLTEEELKKLLNKLNED